MHVKIVFYLGVLLLTSCLSIKTRVAGTYNTQAGRTYYPCDKFTFFSDKTFEQVICADIRTSVYGKWEIQGDTLLIKGLKGHYYGYGNEKYLIKRNKLHKIDYDGSVIDRWRFKKVNNLVIPFRSRK